MSRPLPGYGDEASWPACDGDPADPRTPESDDESGDDGAGRPVADYHEWSYDDERELDDAQYWERCP